MPFHCFLIKKDTCNVLKRRKETIGFEVAFYVGGIKKILQLIWLQSKEESFLTIGRGGGSRPLGVKESQKVVFKLR